MVFGITIPLWVTIGLGGLILAYSVLRTYRATGHQRRVQAYLTLTVALLVATPLLPETLGLWALGMALLGALAAFFSRFTEPVSA